jgi:predicted nucleic acid-binding protein
MIYLLDTNVISELRKAKTPKANKNVIAWIESIPSSRLFISVITVLELEMGILSLERKDKKQGQVLRRWFEDHVLPTFRDRTLEISIPIALKCAKLHVPDPKSDRDAMIAATALNHGMTIATRNTQDFKHTGVELFNPWE